MSVGTPNTPPGAPRQEVPRELLTQLEWLEEQYELKAVDIAPTPGGALTGSRQVINGGARRLCGWEFTETTGTASAALRLHDGGAAGDAVLVRINLAANESTRDWLDKHGLSITTGKVWFEFLSGSIEGVLWVR